MTRKSLLAILLSVALVVGVFASSEAEPEAVSGPVTLTWGVFGDFESILNAIQATEEWQAAFPEVDLELIVGDYGGHHNRLVTVFAAGEGANDLEYCDFGYIGQFVNAGYLTDLSDLGGEDAVGDLAAFAVDNGRDISGNLMGFPVDLAPTVIYYNVDTVTASGVSIEEMEGMQTWEDFFSICQRLTLDTDGDGTIDQYAIPGVLDVADVPLNGGKGNWFGTAGQPFTPEAKFKNVLEMVAAVEPYAAGYGQWSGEWIGGIYGDFAMFPTGFWMLGHLKNWMAPDLAGSIRVAPTPVQEEIASNGGSYITIPTTTPSDKVAIAYAIAEFLVTSEAAQLAALTSSGAFPALTTLYDDPVMDEPVEYLGGQQARALAASLVEMIPQNEVTADDAAMLSVWRTAIANVVEADMSVNDAYAAAVEEALPLLQ